MRQSVPRVLKVVVNSTFVLMDPLMEQRHPYIFDVLSCRRCWMCGTNPTYARWALAAE